MASSISWNFLLPGKPFPLRIHFLLVIFISSRTPRLLYMRNNRFKLRMHFQWNFIHRKILISPGVSGKIISRYLSFRGDRVRCLKNRRLLFVFEFFTFPDKATIKRVSASFWLNTNQTQGSSTFLSKQRLSSHLFQAKQTTTKDETFKVDTSRYLMHPPLTIDILCEANILCRNYKTIF